jgi:hypothetical protein
LLFNAKKIVFLIFLQNGQQEGDSAHTGNIPGPDFIRRLVVRRRIALLLSNFAGRKDVIS